eukprot:g58400.t1
MSLETCLAERGMDQALSLITFRFLFYALLLALNASMEIQTLQRKCVQDSQTSPLPMTPLFWITLHRAAEGASACLPGDKHRNPPPDLSTGSEFGNSALLWPPSGRTTTCAWLGVLGLRLYLAPCGADETIAPFFRLLREVPAADLQSPTLMSAGLRVKNPNIPIHARFG